MVIGTVTQNIAHKIIVKNPEITITDPKTNGNDYHMQVHIDNLLPGVYNCCVETMHTKIWQEPVLVSITLIHEIHDNEWSEDTEIVAKFMPEMDTNLNYKKLWDIQPDEFVGFFQNKPDFTKNEYEKFIKKAKRVNICNDKINGFFVKTPGYSYGFDVYANTVKTDKEYTTAVTIKFI